MTHLNFIARTLTGIIAFGFLFAAIFDVLDYAIVKLLLFILFGGLVTAMFICLYKNKNHPEI